MSSWTWNGFEGAPIRVEVYSDADEIELLLNGESVGRAPAGEAHRFRAEFDATYEAGELVAVAYVNGREQGRHRLVSATGPVRLEIEADRATIRADSADLSHLSHYPHRTDRDRPVTVGVDDSGVLQGLGSAWPETQERFTDDTHTTFDGRALVVIRPTGPGEIVVMVSANGCESVSVTVQAMEQA